MKLNLLAVATASMVLAALLVSCKNSETAPETAMPNGEFIYNVPCKVVNIHQELDGQSILFLWLHGGVHDVAKHDLFEFNHLDCCAADDSVLNYLQKKNIKAIALFPVCHRAGVDHPVHWRDCWGDVKRIIDDYVDKGLVDTNRIYLAGSSDGGVGTWDYAQMHPELFAVAMPMSCSVPHKVTIPVYFFNTSDEDDTTADVEELKAQGCDITFKHCPQYKHGGDAAECTEEFLDKFFSYRKN
ncbi:MAG: prolyl oligopeptidase family serine peptidase [Bacteroidales bacterium]|nr:prolyl oligopeptidase family serine peptidase [Candidatus Cacconaster equi]